MNIITIGREYGSGGRIIGQRVADKLNIPFYDRELIARVANESGFALEFVEETGEYSTSSSRIFNLYMNAVGRQSMYSADNMPIEDKVNMVQNKVIREIADEGPCVVVGRCADYVLSERKDVINVFIHAQMEEKVKRAVQFYGLKAEHAERALRKRDKARAAHYSQYTDRKWGEATNYHLTLDSGKFGVDGCVEIIIQAAQIK